jgi:cell division transport system permease protein
MAGLVLKAHFPRRRIAQTVIANVFRYLFRGAARNWFRNIGSTAPALSSMTLLLLLSGLVGLVGFALHNLEQVQAGQASLLHVYMRDGVPTTDVNTLWDRLAKDPRVASVTYVTKAEALARAQRIPGLPQLAAATDGNPFPASLDVRVKSIDDAAAIDNLVRTDIAVDALDPTSYDRGAYQRIQAVLFGLAVAGGAFLLLLGFVAVTVTINSIRAAIHSRRDEVSIMQLVGAPRWMVRGPFVVEGAITGALSGALAGLITFGLAVAAMQAASASFTQFAPGVTVTAAALAAALVFAAGLGLGSGSSLIGVRRHLES